MKKKMQLCSYFNWVVNNAIVLSECIVLMGTGAVILYVALYVLKNSRSQISYPPGEVLAVGQLCFGLLARLIAESKNLTSLIKFWLVVYLPPDHGPHIYWRRFYELQKDVVKKAVSKKYTNTCMATSHIYAVIPDRMTGCCTQAITYVI